MAQLKSGSFKLSIEKFNIVDTVKEILQLLKIQVGEQNLILKYEIIGKLPCLIYSDSNRIR